MVVAAVVTTIVLPLAFMASGKPSTQVAATTAPTTTYDLGLASSDTVDAPANLTGPGDVAPVGPGAIAYPADNSGRILRGKATFHRFPDSVAKACATNELPLGTVITVRNLNNGRKASCTNINVGFAPAGADIVLGTELFAQIAQLIDAPLPVELTW